MFKTLFDRIRAIRLLDFAVGLAGGVGLVILFFAVHWNNGTIASREEVNTLIVCTPIWIVMLTLGWRTFSDEKPTNS